MVLENFIVDAPIVWDRVGKKIFENPHVKQGRKMRVQITNAGMVEDLSGYTLSLGWKHTVSGVDGLDVFEDSSEANVGIFEMAYTENLMTNLGNLKASLVLTSVEDMVVAESNDFYVKVDDSPFGADAEQGVGSYTRLAQILLNEESRIASEVARVSAEETRVTDFNALVDSEIIAQNVATKLQAKEAEYLPRLVSNEQQLAEAESQLQSTESANAKDILRIENYLGNFQNIHPKVLYFHSGWNGFKYWIAYTPYPNGATSAENPCIAVSNDMVTWTVPTGLINPLDPEPASGYNSDTHLLHRSDTGVMEIWWRQYRASDGMRIYYRRTSTDGVNWTAKEIIFTVGAAEEMLSPAVMFEEGKYKLWFVRDGVRYRESVGDTISSWTAPELLNIHWNTVGVTPWHLDVIKTEIGYELLVQGFKVGGNNNSSDLYFVFNKSNGVYTLPKRVLAKSKNPTAIDHTGIYRSSFIKVNGVYYVFYSCLDKEQNRWMAIAYGDSISGLNGFDYLRGGERVLTLTDAGNVEIDVSQYDTIKILGTGTTTITILKGGYVGKKISVILGSSNATLKCIINSNGGYLALPLQKNITLEYGGKTFANLICYQDTPGLINSGWWWRTDSYVPPNIVKTKTQIGAGVVATDFNVSGVDIIELTGAGSTINSFAGGYVGQVIHIICSSGSASTTFAYSSRLLPPGLVNYAMGISKMGMTAVCVYGDTWRVF